MNDQQFNELLKRLDSATAGFGSTLWPEIVQRHVVSGYFDLFVGVFYAAVVGALLLATKRAADKLDEDDGILLWIGGIVGAGLTAMPAFVNLNNAVITLSSPKASALMELLRGVQ